MCLHACFMSPFCTYMVMYCYWELFTGTMNFNAYHGCLKCVTIGEYYDTHRMSFPRTDCPLRTDESFRRRADEDHHNGTSPLEALPIDMVKDFVIADELRLLHYGVMKRLLLKCWISGTYSYDTKWSGIQMTLINHRLLEFNLVQPIEIHRATRLLTDIKFWKATEFRTFLMYSGIVILREFLPTEAYSHFLKLFCAVRIFSNEIYLPNIEYAQTFFEDFIEQYSEIYGVDSIVSNIHNLCHVTDDVKRFGPLNEISTYPFENALYMIKKMVMGGRNNLVQVAKRIISMNVMPSAPSNKSAHNVLSQRKDNRYEKVILSSGVTFTSHAKNKWFLTIDNKVIEFQSAISMKNEIHFWGRPIIKTTDFFVHPMKSSLLHIYLVEEKFGKIALYPVSRITAKMVGFPIASTKRTKMKQIVFIPLLHTQQ